MYDIVFTYLSYHTGNEKKNMNDGLINDIPNKYNKTNHIFFLIS